ncbi:DsbA family protein [Lelliottia sp. CFBP8978]|nr:DsbA family protein [Lelliottia sp. CFBP8978]MDY1038700.1 DsbA family protein [Lelliottia sp. CFBP8978]
MLLQSSLKSPLSRTGLALLMTLSGFMSVMSTASAADAAPVADTAPASGALTPTQIGQIAEEYLVAHPDKLGEVMATYLAEHPEFLVAAGESLRQRQQISQQQMFVQMAVTKQATLLDSQSPSVGPADAKAAVVMFFDYQCSYCGKMAPVVEALIKANPDVRFVFKEFPIFASRWPVSALAARVGEQIWLNKGGAAYLAYHNALYATGHVEGQMTEKDVQEAAKPYLNEQALKAIELAQNEGPVHDALQANADLAKEMNFTGTPAFVVMPQAQNPDAQRISVVPGSTSQEMLQMAIQKARG